MPYVNAACPGMLLLLVSTGVKFCPVSNFTQLHTLALAARSYVLLLYIVYDVHDEESCVKYLLCRLEGRHLLFGTYTTVFGP